jgi:uncharacterized protein YqgV (UPF0045/DUF77 family)
MDNKDFVNEIPSNINEIPPNILNSLKNYIDIAKKYIEKKNVFKNNPPKEIPINVPESLNHLLEIIKEANRNTFQNQSPGEIQQLFPISEPSSAIFSTNEMGSLLNVLDILDILNIANNTPVPQPESTFIQLFSKHQPSSTTTISTTDIVPIFDVLDETNKYVFSEEEYKINLTPEQPPPIITNDGISELLNMIKIEYTPQSYKLPDFMTGYTEMRIKTDDPDTLINLIHKVTKLSEINKTPWLSIQQWRAIIMDVWNKSLIKPNLRPKMDSWIESVREQSQGDTDSDNDSDSSSTMEGGNNENNIFIANEMTPLYVKPSVTNPDDYDFIGTFGQPVNIEQNIKIPPVRFRLYRNKKTMDFHREYDGYYSAETNNDDDGKYGNNGNDDGSEKINEILAIIDNANKNNSVIDVKKKTTSAVNQPRISNTGR